MTNVINTRDAAEEAQKTALDAASEFGYEMGVISEQTRIYEEIDAISKSLTDEEEDAKLTIEIIKQVILNRNEDSDE